MKFFWIFILALNLFAGWRDSVCLNWNGYTDTASISGTLTDGTKKYTSFFVIGDNMDLIAVCMVDDTAEAGFADDSVNYEWGIQTACVCLDSGETIDTCLDEEIVLDTMDAGAYGTANVQTMGTDESVTRTLGGHDTTNVDGYVYQVRRPEYRDIWNCLVRGWVNSIGDPSKDGAGLDIRFQFIQKQYNSVRRK